MRGEPHKLDGAALFLDRATGVNRLERGPDTRDFRREAPRSLQVGLLSNCNMACSFCYRDSKAENRLSSEYLVKLLSDAAKWGVLEVAFGGGEPLLFPDFPELLQTLHKRTGLALNFTTNGKLLDAEMLARLGAAPSEIRVSAYEDNGYRRTLSRLQGHNAGVNWLVTPNNVGLVETYVHDFLEQGARNVLMLGYMGPDEEMHLTETDRDVLRDALTRLYGLPIRLHICWYPHFHDLPHLFQRPDCGAADEFMVITPDRCVQACSFSADKYPFTSIGDLKRIYADLRQRRPAADIGGCTRGMFSQLPAAKAPDGTFIWRSFSSNNSGDWSIIGKFSTLKEAEQAAEALRRMARAHEAFLSSTKGQEWEEANGYDGSIPTPPLVRFGEAHGFDWSASGDGLWWEENGAGAPVLTAGVIGTSVLVYHEYCMGLPERPFREFFEHVGAVSFGYWQYDQPPVHISAQGPRGEAVDQLERYVAYIRGHEFPPEEPPPWGTVCKDSRVEDDEDRSARLRDVAAEVRHADGRLDLRLCFANAFAGTLAVAAWLATYGFTGVRSEVEAGLEGLEGMRKIVPADASVFPKVEPRDNIVSAMSLDQLIDEAFGKRELDLHVKKALQRQSLRQLDFRAHSKWKALVRANPKLVPQASRMIEILGPVGADWARELWQHTCSLPLEDSQMFIHWALSAMKAALEPDETFAMARDWLARASSKVDQGLRLSQISELEHPGTLELLESYFAQWTPSEPVGDSWGGIAEKCRLDWNRAKRWLESGRPLSLVALDAMMAWRKRGPPKEWGTPSRDAFVDVLESVARRDNVPRVERAVKALLRVADKFVAGR